jgi:intracellular sulfur oxidation DsrE/DsrF family protein
MALLAIPPAALCAADAEPTGGVPGERGRLAQVEHDPRQHQQRAGRTGRVEVTVVVIGPGLGMLKADALTANRVQDAMAAGVRFVACGNSMTAQKLGKDDMIDGIAYAKAGYVELMRLQQQGWIYLRP